MELPRRGGVEWVGDPLESGSFIMSFADTRPGEIYLALALATATKNGDELTPELLRFLKFQAAKRDAEFYAEVRARGVSKGIRDLLGARRKKDVERVADEIVVEASEFTDLTINSRMVGLSHHPSFHRFEPEQRVLTEAERATFLAAGSAPPAPASPGEEKVAAKVRQLFVEREHRSVHMFANSDEWHCFFFSFEDAADGENHWEGGSHVHFVNHLFGPRFKKKAVWRQLAERRHAVPKVHVRYREREQRQPHDGTLLYVEGGTGRYRKVAPKA